MTHQMEEFEKAMVAALPDCNEHMKELFRKDAKGDYCWVGMWFAWVAWQAMGELKAPDTALAREAYLDGYHEGAGDDAWYADRDDLGEVKPDTFAAKKADAYIKELIEIHQKALQQAEKEQSHGAN